MAPEGNRDCWSTFLSPLKLILLAVNAICFGGLLALLAAGRVNGLWVVGTGLVFFSLLTGALVASRRARAARRAAATGAATQEQEHDA